MKKKSMKNKKKIKQTISLCMIVKNEETFLDNCLGSVCDYVDEIVIVDTGSTDRTCDIAQKYGARIFHHLWENDFSKHRNQSLHYATGQWILVMDADEELFPEDGSLLREIILKHHADYYHCRFYDMKCDGSVGGEFTLPRLFRNRLDMRYIGQIHEQLQIKGKGFSRGPRFRHYGYDLSPDIMEAKHKRTTELLKKTLVSNPEDAYCQFQLATSYSMHDEFDKAVEHGEAALDIMRRRGLRDRYFVVAFYTVAQGYYASGHYTDAERICLEALDFFPHHLDCCHILANIYFQNQMFDKFKATSHQYLRIYDAFKKDPSLMQNLYINSFGRRSDIFYGLGCAYFFEGDHAVADQYLFQAFEESGGKMKKAEGACLLYLERGFEDRAMPWLMRAYRAGRTEGSVPDILKQRKDLYLKMGNLFLKDGDGDAAFDCLEKIPDDGISVDEKLGKHLSLAGLCWQQGIMEELVKNLESIVILLDIDTLPCIDSMEDLGKIFYDVAEAFCRRSQWHLAEPALQLAIQIAPSLFEPDKFNKILQSVEARTGLPS